MRTDEELAKIADIKSSIYIWVGGGTLIPWAVIPAAAMCGVDPFELARKNLKPVVIGLLITTIAAIFLL